MKTIKFETVLLAAATMASGTLSRISNSNMSTYDYVPILNISMQSIFEVLQSQTIEVKYDEVEDL